MIPTCQRLRVLSIYGHPHHCCLCCHSLVVDNNPSLLPPPSLCRARCFTLLSLAMHGAHACQPQNACVVSQQMIVNDPISLFWWLIVVYFYAICSITQIDTPLSYFQSHSQRSWYWHRPMMHGAHRHQSRQLTIIVFQFDQIK